MALKTLAGSSVVGGSKPGTCGRFRIYWKGSGSGTAPVKQGCRSRSGCAMRLVSRHRADQLCKSAGQLLQISSWHQELSNLCSPGAEKAGIVGERDFGKCSGRAPKAECLWAVLQVCSLTMCWGPCWAFQGPLGVSSALLSPAHRDTPPESSWHLKL